VSKLIFLCIIGLGSGAAWSQDIALPDIGASADRLISPEQERRIGVGMMREFRAHDLVLEDPLVNDYLRGLGYRLVAQSERQDDNFTFFMVRSDDINAFAAPGGYVAVNVGLLHTAETESEVAAVLGHEIAHVSQRHLVRAVESMQKVSLPILLGMVGAAIAAQSAGNGDGTQAALISGLGLMQQKSINFTRDNEYEADRIGIHTLYRAGFDPDAMAGFFSRMRGATRVQGREQPEFLRTHPVTASRVSEAKNRASAIRQQPLPVAIQPQANERQFQLIRERAHVLNALRPNELVEFYRGQIAAHPNSSLEWARYGLGLAQWRSHQFAAALATLQALAQADPNNPLFELPLAEVETELQQAPSALKRLQRMTELYPGNRAVMLGYADQLIQTGTAANGALASGLLRDVLNRSGDDPAVQSAFARAAELSGQELRALEAHAEVALQTGQLIDAMAQLQRLLRNPKIDYYQRARVEARIAQLTPYILEIQRELGKTTPRVGRS